MLGGTIRSLAGGKSASSVRVMMDSGSFPGTGPAGFFSFSSILLRFGDGLFEPDFSSFRSFGGSPSPRSSTGDGRSEEDPFSGDDLRDFPDSDESLLLLHSDEDLGIVEADYKTLI